MSNGMISQDAQLDVSFNVNGSFAFVATSKTITRSTGSFITDGVLPGQAIETDKVSNPGPFTVVTATATVITVSETVVDAAASAVQLTMFQEVGELRSCDTPSSERDEIEMTHLKSKGKEFKLGLADGGSIAGECNFVTDDPGQKILRVAKNEKAARKFRISFPAYTENGVLYKGYRWKFSALVKDGRAPVAVNDRVPFNFTLRVTGDIIEEILSA